MLAARFGGPSVLPAEPLTLRPESFFRDSPRKKLSKRLRRALPRAWRKSDPGIAP
jgi:hypothetical protein